jgi:hypothetical protein
MTLQKYIIQMKIKAMGKLGGDHKEVGRELKVAWRGGWNASSLVAIKIHF